MELNWLLLLTLATIAITSQAAAAYDGEDGGFAPVK